MLQEAAELKVNALVPDETKKVLEEAEGMHVKWKDDRKAKEASMARKAEEEEALHKGKEPVHSDCGEEDVSNEAAHLFDDDTSLAHEAEEEEKELMPAAKLMAKPAPTKQIKFHAMRAMPASSPSVRRSMRSMEVVIPV